MNKILLLTIATFALAACAEKEPMSYTQDSWKTMISDDCSSFFDGCNNCRRGPNSEVAACTKKFCPTYTEPKCLDE